MDKLNAYTGLNIADAAMDHVRAILAVCFPDTHIGTDYDEDHYKSIDARLRENPCDTAMDGMVFDNLKDMAKALSDEYERTMNNGINVPVDENADESVFMATNFGIVR